VLSRAAQLALLASAVLALGLATAIMLTPADTLAVHFDSAGRPNAAATRGDVLTGHILLTVVFAAGMLLTIKHPRRQLRSFDRRTPSRVILLLSACYLVYVVAVTYLIGNSWATPT
jgi:hypothetical protein